MSTTQTTIETEVSNETTEKKYRDRDWLVYQYHELGRTQAEIAELCGCSHQTIYNWMDKLEIKTRGRGRPQEYASYRNRPDNYTEWRCWVGGTEESVSVHRLLATLKVDNLDELGGKHVHHKSHIPWLNTLEGIEVMEPSEHRKHHKNGEKPEILGQFR